MAPRKWRKKKALRLNPEAASDRSADWMLGQLRAASTPPGLALGPWDCHSPSSAITALSESMGNSWRMPDAFRSRAGSRYSKLDSGPLPRGAAQGSQEGLALRALWVERLMSSEQRPGGDRAEKGRRRRRRRLQLRGACSFAPSSKWRIAALAAPRSGISRW